MFRKKINRQEIKKKARRTLNNKFSQASLSYVCDTSAIINHFVSSLIKKGLKGKIIIPNALMAELENLANRGQQAGFTGLEEVAGLHKLKKQFKIQIFFQGIRPGEAHIKFAKSGEIDALIREIAIKNHATLITADLVQAKSAQAYGLNVIFLKPKPEKKKKFLFWTRKS